MTSPLTRSTPQINLSGAGKPGGLFGSGNKNAPKTGKIDDPLLQRLHRLRDSYDESKTTYRFGAVVYNTKTQSSTGLSSSNSKPGSLTDEEWQKAQANSPDPNKFSPFLMCGFPAIEARQSAQVDIVNLMKSKLDDMASKINELSSSFQMLVSSKIQSITERNHHISNSLMQVLETEEVNSLSSFQFSREEHELLDRLEKMQEEIHKPNKFISALNTLSVKAKFMRDSAKSYNVMSINSQISTKSTEILRSNTKAIESLSHQIENLKESVKILEKTLLSGNDYDNFLSNH